jgi:hypothetical protein
LIFGVRGKLFSQMQTYCDRRHNIFGFQPLHNCRILVTRIIVCSVGEVLQLCGLARHTQPNLAALAESILAATKKNPRAVKLPGSRKVVPW